MTAFLFIIPLENSPLIAMSSVSNFCDRHLRIMALAFTLLFTSNCSFCSWNNSEDMIFEQWRFSGHKQFPLMSMVVTSHSCRNVLTVLNISGSTWALFERRTGWLTKSWIPKLTGTLEFYCNPISLCIRTPSLQDILNFSKAFIYLVTRISPCFIMSQCMH